MAIKHWPATERPREKLLNLGPAALSDAELLAIFLRTGVAGKSAIDLARDLLHEFDNLRSLLEADRQTFCAAKGLGDAKFSQLQASLELCRRYLESSLQRSDALTQPADTRAYLKAQLRHHPHEVFACLFMDNQHRVIVYEELFRGTLNTASVHPREVVKRALHHNAAAVILAHNHPSGNTQPSQADQDITQHLQKSLQLVDIRVLDHFIIGDGEALSLAEQGLI